MARAASAALALLVAGGAWPAAGDVPDPYTYTRTNPPPPDPPQPKPEHPADLRPFVIGMELGWNGLTGLGLSTSWRPNLRLAVDGAVGIGVTAARGGVRVRGMSGEGRVVATGGVGLEVAALSRDVSTTVFAQVTAGVQIRRGALDATILVGWAQVVAGGDFRGATGNAWRDGLAEGWTEFFAGGGPVMELTFGHGWGGG